MVVAGIIWENSHFEAKVGKMGKVGILGKKWENSHFEAKVGKMGKAGKFPFRG